MVYCGKPSKGCQMCRTRRIKCDETKPTCNQCAKSRRQCPGYKDEFDLVFRNETQATERRARKANKKALALKAEKAFPRDDSSQTTTTSPSSSSSVSSKEASTSPLLISQAPSVPVETRASCCFVSNFVLMPRPGSTRGFLDFVLPMLRTEGQDSHLQHAFNACGLALLNNRPETRNKAAEKALNEYTMALIGTNRALRDPDAQKADSTLGAVILLGLFENITAKQLGTLAWGSHIEGAIQLVKARGRKQLRTKIGLLLFIAVRTQMIIHTLTSGKAPIMGMEWWIEDAVKDEYAAKCQRIMIKTGELRAEVTRLMICMVRSPDNIEIMLHLIKRVQKVDGEAVQWMTDAPDIWRYMTVAWVDQVPSNGDYSRAEVFPGRVDLYTDFWIASVWNMARTSRLILASLIVRCAAWVCSPVDYRTTPEFATAARTCVDTITDIIASVPYHLGWHLKKPEVMSKANLGQFACGQENAMKSLAGYFLTWPLGCLWTQDYLTDAQRAWVHGRLKYIGEELGVKYAIILAQLQIRVPSMMIRRDGLMASPYGAAQNFEKLLSARSTPPAYDMKHLQQKEHCPQPRAGPELMPKATVNAPDSVTGTGPQSNFKYIAQIWPSSEEVGSGQQKNTAPSYLSSNIGPQSTTDHASAQGMLSTMPAQGMVNTMPAQHMPNHMPAQHMRNAMPSNRHQAMPYMYNQDWLTTTRSG